MTITEPSTINDSSITSSGKELLSINFNQEYSCISVGTKSGYQIYNCDPFQKSFSKVDEEIRIVEMLFSTSLVALVGPSPRRLRINNTKRESTICELTFHTSILSVKMNRKRLIVVLEDQIFIYDISNMKLLHTIDTIPNPLAIAALSPSVDNCYIACQPLRSSADYYSTNLQQNIGDIEIYDANAMKLANIVQAHKSPISCIAMNSDGTLLVTASEKGTVIRVFTVPSAEKVYQFRRGSYPAKIFSMSFNLVSTLLCVSSDTETVHIFKLSDSDSHEEDEKTIPKHKPSSFRGMGSFLPDRLTDIWDSSRHFASLKLPNAGVRSLVALSSTTPQVFVITSEGYFYQYNIDLENGGECVLLRQNRMREPNFSSPAQNRAAVVITSTLYDRRALDCTATLPLVNSLTHLAYMTSTSPRIREILAADGGLERLVKILATCQHTDKHSLWKWSLAFQCVVNVGVRGTETIRSRVVEAGAVHVVLAILENFMNALDQAKIEKDQERKQQQQQTNHHNNNNNIHSTALSLPTMPILPQQQQQYDKVEDEVENNNQLQHVHSHIKPCSSSSFLFVFPKRKTFISRTTKPKSKPYTASLSSIPLLNNLSTDAILHREEDILLSLQLLAYLSKYPQIRQAFHSNHRLNVFSVVEKFTHRLHPAAIIYWAGVIMRNACRKDEARGGVRQCANMQCGKWEHYPREFAKCRRCRKAKYCSKSCQSKAWADGHRWWCVERPHNAHPPNPTATSSTTVAAAAAVVAAAPPPPPTEQVVHLEDNVVTSDVLAIPINGHQGDANTNATTETNHNRRSSLPVTTTTADHNNMATTTNRPPPPRDAELLFYHQRRNSRSVRSLASGSSTEVEADTDNSHDRPRDLMDVD